MRYLMPAALLGLAIAAGPAQAQNKASIAVAPFTFNRDFRAQPGAELETGALTQKLVTALVNTRKFDVVERQRVDTLLDEMQLSEAGLTDPTRAVEAGRMLGADYFVMGEISVFTATTEVKAVPMTSRWLRNRELHLVVDMRIVNTRTSKVSSAERGEVRTRTSHKYKERPSVDVPITPSEVEAVEREMASQLVLKVIDAVYPIKVIGVNGSGVVSINRGKGGGVAPGDVLDVFTEGEEMVDPDTGEVLGSEETKVGRIRVEQVLAKFSKCSLLSGRADRGYICRPARGEAKFAPPPPPPPPADTSPPQIRILAPKEGATLNSSPINVVCEVSDDCGVTRVAIAGRNATQDGGRWKGQVLPNEGGNLVRIEAWDAAGNCGHAEVRFNYDATPPEVEADATILVEGKVDDLGATLTINGVQVPFDPQTGHYSARVPADPNDPGKVTIVATDEFGNKSTEVRRVH